MLFVLLTSFMYLLTCASRWGEIYESLPPAPLLCATRVGRNMGPEWGVGHLIRVFSVSAPSRVDLDRLANPRHGRCKVVWRLGLKGAHVAPPPCNPKGIGGDANMSVILFLYSPTTSPFVSSSH